MSEDFEVPPSARSPSPSSRVKKRKRSDLSAEELEVDIDAPEPPSKKALRKAKKAKSPSAAIKSGAKSSEPIAKDKDVAAKSSKKAIPTIPNGTSKPTPTPAATASGSDNLTAAKTQNSQRSDYGVWIGNLPWSATKEILRRFLRSSMDIPEEVITRIHLPNGTGMSHRENKGFAYVDFSTRKAWTVALGMNETLLTGRRVLIKDSKSFEGRPEKPKIDAKQDAPLGKAPSKRIFVGNLGFDTTKEDIQDHFSRCGNIVNVHLATFEDSGKCKGYGWVEFDTVEAGQAAVRGWVNIEQKQDDSDAEDNQENESEKATRMVPKKKLRPRKWWVNQLQRRLLRMEFAEDKATRYKRRFGKNGTAQKDTPLEAESLAPVHEPARSPPPANKALSSGGIANAKKLSSKKKFDARTIKPGAAHAAAPRLQGAVVPSQGKKTVLG